MEFWRVQVGVVALQVTCQNKASSDLDAQVSQLRETLVAPRACGVHYNLGIVSTLVNSLGGDFLLGHSRQTRAKRPLNPETVSGHTVAGTWVARLRAMLPLGHARTSKLTGQQMKENVSALNAGNARGRTEHLRPIKLSGNQPAKGRDATACRYQHSEHCGFLSLSHFMGWRLLLTPQGLPYFFPGGAFCFLLFLFVLISLSHSTLPDLHTCSLF